MVLEDELPLSKELILSKVSQAEIFMKYLQIEDVSFKKHYPNRLRKDDFPSCSFFVSNKTNMIVFNDFSWRMFDCFNVVEVLYHVKFHKALEIIANDFNIRNKYIESTEQQVTIINNPIKRITRIKARDFTIPELQFWSIGGFKVQQKQLNARNIFAVENWLETKVDATYNYFENCRMTFAYKWCKDTFQMYMPKANKDLGYRRFANPVGIRFGDIEFLPKTGKFCIITKAKKCSFFLSLFRLPSFFLINERIMLSDEEMNKLYNRFDHVFTLFDNDLTGIKLSQEYRHKHGTVPLLIKRQYGKDFTDFLANVGRDKVLDTINYLIEYYDLGNPTSYITELESIS